MGVAWRCQEGEEQGRREEEDDARPSIDEVELTHFLDGNLMIDSQSMVFLNRIGRAGYLCYPCRN